MENDLIYLNTAGTGITLPEGTAAARSFLDQLTTNPHQAFMDWMAEDLPQLRKNAAALFHTTEEQIAFLPNFSFALAAVIGSLAGRKRRVLLYDTDYPSLNLPFEINDFDVFYVKDQDGYHLSNEALFDKIEKENIEILALSHVQFLTGFKIDLAEIGRFCREKGVIFIVDGTQSMGATPLDFEQLPLDVLIGSSYKWLNGGFGSAILCLKTSFIAEFPPRIAGFGSIDHSSPDWNYYPSNKSFEPGHLSAAPLLLLNSGIRHKLRAGVSNIARHNSALIRQLHEGLSSLPFEITGHGDLDNRLHILIFKAAKEIADELEKRNIVITWRRNTIRVSPHFQNTAKEIARFLDILEDIAQKKHL